MNSSHRNTDMKVKEGFVESQGHRLACLAVNEHLARDDEPCFVFIHGVLASVNFWRECVPERIREHRAWYALSLPAHHPSSVPADFTADQVDERWFFDVMNDALQHLLKGRKAIVVGHSTGGFSALNLAIHQAPNVLGIVSIAGFHSGRWGGVEGLLVKLAGLGRWARIPFQANLALGQQIPLAQRIFASLLAKDARAYRRNPLSQGMLDAMAADTRDQDPAALFPLFNGISRLEIADQLQRIALPCHLFVGSDDPVVPAKQSLLLASRIPQARVTVFENVGHMPFIEDPQNFDRALEQALADIEAQDEPGRIKPNTQETAA